MTVDFSTETIEARRKQHNIFQRLKENNCQPRIFVSWKCPLGIRGNQDIFRWKKTKRIHCHFHYLKIMANGSSLNRVNNKKNLEISGRKKQCSKQNIVDFLSWLFKIISYNWNKNYDTVWHSSECMQTQY